MLNDEIEEKNQSRKKEIKNNLNELG